MMRRDPLAVLAGLSLLVAAGLGYWILHDDAPAPSGGGVLTVHCAAGIRAPIVEVAKAYEAEYGTPVRLVFGGSGTLLSGLSIRTPGDLYIAGDDSYVQTAQQRGLVAEILSIATMRPVIAVRSDNPHRIEGLRDLLRDGVAFGLGNPEATAVGKIVQQTAKTAAMWSALRAAAVVFKPTVNELANDLRLATIDAAVIWDATARQHGLAFVVDADLAEQTRRVTLGILAGSEQPTRALHFARYLTARDRGLTAVAQAGFRPVDGDLWCHRPRLSLMSGAMLRPAIEATLSAFEKREGVIIERIYNGCGILTAQIRTGAQPDAYFACDQTFLDSVSDRFEPGTTVSTNEIVLVSSKGNPHGLRRWPDLIRGPLRVGLGHPSKSALGALTRVLLQRLGLDDRLRAGGNLAVESPTGDMLVNQLRAGALDAIIVYRSNVAHSLEHCEVLEPELAGRASGSGSPARASQPYAVAKNSPHRHLMRRLRAALRGAESARRFRSMGFVWQGASGPR